MQYSMQYISSSSPNLIIVLELCAKNFRGSINMWWRLLILYMEKDTCFLINLYHVINEKMASSSNQLKSDLAALQVGKSDQSGKKHFPFVLRKRLLFIKHASRGRWINSLTNLGERREITITLRNWKWIHKCYFFTVFNQTCVLMNLYHAINNKMA